MTTNTNKLSLLERCKNLALSSFEPELARDILAAIAAERSVSEAEPKMSLPVRILAITTAYEQGFGKGQKKTVLECPYTKGDWLGCDIAWQLGYDEGAEKPNAPTAKPSQVNSKEPFADMTWEEFAKIAYESSAEHRKSRLLASGRKHEAECLNLEFYELDSEKIEAWTHGCAVALAAYKKLFTSPQLKPLSDEEMREMAAEENCLLLDIEFDAFKRGVRAIEAKLGAKP